MTALLATAAPLAAGSAPVSAENPGDRDAEAVRAFLAELAEASVSERSARVYVAHLGRFAGWLRDRYGPDRGELLAATGRDVRAYQHQLAMRQRPASVNNTLAALRRFYRWVHAAGRLPADPTARVKPAPAQPLAPKGFSAVERNRLVREAERAGAVASAIVVTLLHTGLRVEELCGLTWEAVTLSPREGSARVVGKGRKLRTVPLNAAVRDALAAVRLEAVPVGPIFRGKRGPYSPRGIRELLAVLGRRAAVADVHPHRFRHDAARRLVAAGVDLPTVAALLGHSRLETVRIYSQPGEGELQRAAARLEEGRGDG